MFPIVENTKSSLQSRYLVSRSLSLLRKGSLIFYFLYNILLIFPQIVLFIFRSLKLSCCHFQSSSLCLKLEGRHYFLPAEKANIPTIVVHLDGGKAVTWSQDVNYKSLFKGTYFSVFTLLRYNTFCSYWMRMIKENEKHIQTFEFKENINFGHEVSHFTLVNIQRCFQVLML